MQPILTKTKWEAPSLDPRAVAEFTSSMRKLSDKRQIARTCGIPVDQLTFEWAGPPDPRRHLFVRSPSSGKLSPKAPYSVERWVALVRGYCGWHEISHLDQLVDLWCELVDGFFRCENFEADAPPEFRAWAFGCLSKFILERRKRAPSSSSTVPDIGYDPENPRGH